MLDVATEVQLTPSSSDRAAGPAKAATLGTKSARACSGSYGSGADSFSLFSKSDVIVHKRDGGSCGSTAPLPPQQVQQQQQQQLQPTDTTFASSTVDKCCNITCSAATADGHVNDIFANDKLSVERYSLDRPCGLSPKSSSCAGGGGVGRTIIATGGDTCLWSDLADGGCCVGGGVDQQGSRLVSPAVVEFGTDGSRTPRGSETFSPGARSGAATFPFSPRVPGRKAAYHRRHKSDAIASFSAYSRPSLFKCGAAATTADQHPRGPTAPPDIFARTSPRLEWGLPTLASAGHGGAPNDAFLTVDACSPAAKSIEAAPPLEGATAAAAAPVAQCRSSSSLHHPVLQSSLSALQSLQKRLSDSLADEVRAYAFGKEMTAASTALLLLLCIATLTANSTVPFIMMWPGLLVTLTALVGQQHGYLLILSATINGLYLVMIAAAMVFPLRGFEQQFDLPLLRRLLCWCFLPLGSGFCLALLLVGTVDPGSRIGNDFPWTPLQKKELRQRNYQAASSTFAVVMCCLNCCAYCVSGVFFCLCAFFGCVAGRLANRPEPFLFAAVTILIDFGVAISSLILPLAGFEAFSEETFLSQLLIGLVPIAVANAGTAFYLVYGGISMPIRLRCGGRQRGGVLLRKKAATAGPGELPRFIQ